MNLRLTWQAARRSTRSSFYYDNQGRDWDDSRADDLARVGRGLSLPDAQPGAGRLDGAADQQAAGRSALRATAARRSATSCRRKATSYRELIPVIEQSTGLLYRGKGGDGGSSALFGYTSQNDQHGWSSSMSYVTGRTH